MSRKHWLRSLFAAIGILLGIVVFALLEGDFPDLFGDVTEAVSGRLRQQGPALAFAVLYLEESGVPSPVPGDVFVLYLGRDGAGNLTKLILYWLGATTVVALGATNLYLLSRRFGHALLAGRLGRIVHVTPARLEKAERSFQRYGAPALIFGRHIPGFRIPLTVAAGVLEVPYRVFVPSVALSTAIWAGVWITLGARYGTAVTQFLDLHRRTFLLIPAALAVAVAVFIVRHLRARRRRPAATTP